MPRLQLRDYQEECVQAHFDWFSRHAEGNPLFVVPTGAGKSLIIAEFIRRSLEAWPDCRFLVPTHVKELVQQNHDEFVGHARDAEWFDSATAGIYSAGIGRFDAGCRVVFCNVQSVASRARELGRFDLVLVDEAHLVPKRGEGRYRTLVEGLTERNPQLRVCGYTATHYRLDGGYLHRGEDRIFTDVAYEVRLEQLVPEYLSPVVTRLPGDGQVDATGVKKSGGDFNLRALGEVAENAQCVADAVDDLVRRARASDRKSWLIFCTTVRHAELVAQRLQRRHRVGCDLVHGGTSKADRRATVDAFRAGELTAIANVGVLTTGFNAPRCDMLVLLRPTASAALYVQMVGRGMRKFPGKQDCLVLDYGENVLRHGPINAVRPRKVAGGGEPRARICPECDGASPVGTLRCVECDYEFRKPCPVCGLEVVLRTKTCPCGYEWIREHLGEASSLDAYDPKAREPKVVHVAAWFFRRHEKEGSPDSLRVDYMVGVKSYSEWVCLEHEGWPGRKADRWWTDHGGRAPQPGTVVAALERVDELRKPDAIEVVRDEEFDRVARHFYRRDAASSE